MKTQPALSFGTLASPLAKAQTQDLIDKLQEQHPRLTCQMTVIPSPLDAEGRSGEPFLAATAAEIEFLEDQLLAGHFRILVARAMDLVLPLRDDLVYAAVPARRTPFDALLNRQGEIADDLPADAVVGVLNQRTRVQMSALWPEMRIRLLSGGLDVALETLMRRCDVDALVVPAAAAEHMNLQGIVTEILYPEMMLPSAGQGVLVALARGDDQEAIDLLAPLHSAATFAEMEAEHAFMQRFASDQDLPVSVLARVTRDRIAITGAMGSIRDVDSLNRARREGPLVEGADLGADLAESLLMSGSVIDLLEADFPDGLPEGECEDVDPDGDVPPSERDS